MSAPSPSTLGNIGFVDVHTFEAGGEHSQALLHTSSVAFDVIGGEQ